MNMTDLDSQAFSPEESATASTNLAETPSWSRNPRTSCDACKRMKIKCQRKDDESCTRCITRKLDCITTMVERKKPKLTSGNYREAYLHEMEARIKRMESVIIASGLQGTTDPTEVTEDENSFDKIESQAGLGDHLSALIIDPKGSSNFLGWASGFSLLSPQGLKWISDTVGSQDELSRLAPTTLRLEAGVSGFADVNVWYPMPRSQHAPLPPRDLAKQYCDCYFAAFNHVFPIISKSFFYLKFERQYSANPPTETAWYAMFNAVLCMGIIITKCENDQYWKESHMVDQTSTEAGIIYYRNATSCFLDLILKEANLMAMQALTLILIITPSNPDPHPAYLMTAVAGRLASTLGLHRRLDGFGLDPEEVEQRRNVFWIFYMTEKTISHNLGRPSVINDDDIAVDLPPKNNEPVSTSDGAKMYDIFQDQITLSIIGSRIYSELYSASSQTKSETERMKVLGKLDDHLQRWRDSIPVDIRPEHPIACSHEQFVPVVMMHFTYLNAVILLHRVPVHQESFKDRERKEEKNQDARLVLNPRLYASQLLCLAAARRSVQLLDLFNHNQQQNQHLVWMALYYPLSASLILFTNILKNPQNQHVYTDIQLMHAVTSFITQSVKLGSPFAATRILKLFTELQGIATRFVAQQAPQAGQKMKRPHESEELVQSNAMPSSRVVSASSLSSDVEYQNTNFLTPPDRPTSYSNSDMTTANTSPAYSSQQTPQQDQDTLSAGRYQESAGNSPLDFAPFITPEMNQVDYASTMYDTLLSPMRFEWDMANLWVPNYPPDPWGSTIPMETPDVSFINVGNHYSNGNGNGNHAHHHQSQ